MDSKIQGSKLSATVPAFVPKMTHTGVTLGRFSSNLVINSTLSPFVPEFHPSGPFSPQLSTSYQPTCSLQYNSKQAYLKHQKVDLKENTYQAYQSSVQASTKKSAAKVKRSDNAEKAQESQNVSVDGSSEGLTGKCVHVGTKKRQIKKKESNAVIHHQEKKKLTKSSTERVLHQLKDVSKVMDHVDPKENGVSTSQSNCKSLSSSFETSSSELIFTKDKRTNTTSAANCDSQNNRTQFAAPHLTVSYSDKVKSMSLKNSNTGKVSHGDKTLVKDFVVEHSSKMGNANDPMQNTKLHLGNNGINETWMARNSGCICDASKKPDSTSKTVWGYSEDCQQKYFDSSKSHTSRLKQLPRTGKLMARSNNFKKNVCDDDDNWRVKNEFLHVADLSQTVDSVKKVNIKNPNTESYKKTLGHQGGKKHDVVDAQKYENVDIQTNSTDVADKMHVANTSSRRQNSIGSSSIETSPKLPVKKLESGVSISSQEQEIKQKAAASVTVSCNHEVIEGEFPDLRENVKVKRIPIIDKITVDFKETETLPSEPVAPVSYSAVLRSMPKPKPLVVSSAWVNEKPTTRGGLLKVPSQSGADVAESEPSQGDLATKKTKKKKKKKATESGALAQGSGSAKRTEKPIQFDLGVMLQNISKSSPDGTRQSGKKVVVATGVSPTHLSAVAHNDVKLAVTATPVKKRENKIPHNKLDSTAPVIKRGKERETPAKKKPSALKKIILKEREEKKKARDTSETDVETSDDKTNRACESDISIAHQELQYQSEAETAEEKEPSSPTDLEIAAEIHSRKFREYCFQVLNKEVDAVASELLRELVRFQDRQFHKDPVKAKAKRRFVLGLREVRKHLKLRKLKCVIISSNVERIKSAGGLDDTVGSIISLCGDYHIPVVFALKRQLLGKVLLKKVPVSIVGIFNYDGAQEHFKTLMELTQKTEQAYTKKWQEAKEKLELQQQVALATQGAEIEIEPIAEAQEVDDLSETVDKGLETEDDHTSAHDTESSDDEDSGGDGHEIPIADDGLKIQDL